MRHEAWAQEISTSLQSAFRVLALTRPELPQVTTMLLKTKGFRHSEELSEKVHECLALIRQELGEAVQERDDWFSLTTRAVKRLVDVASGMRKDSEFQSMAETLELFVGESVAAYVTQKGLQIERASLQVRSIIEKVFALKLSTAIVHLNDLPQDSDLLLWDTSFTTKLSLLHDFLQNRRPVLLVGGPRTGKQTLTETAASLLHLQQHYLNPDVAGTFRELYGDHDPFSISGSL